MRAGGNVTCAQGEAELAAFQRLALAFLVATEDDGLFRRLQIKHFLATHNRSPKRYVWRADPKQVLEKIDRAWESLLGAMYEPISVTAH